MDLHGCMKVESNQNSPFDRWNKPLIAQLWGCSTNPVTVWVFLLARLADSPRCSPDRVVTRRLPLRHPGKPLFATVTCIGGLGTHWWTGSWFCFIIFFVIPNPLVALVGPNPYTKSQFAMLNGEEVEVWQAFSHVQYSHGNYSHPSVGESQRENWGRTASTLGLHPELV